MVEWRLFPGLLLDAVSRGRKERGGTLDLIRALNLVPVDVFVVADVFVDVCVDVCVDVFVDVFVDVSVSVSVVVLLPVLLLL
jgi:hypothetical protein